MSVHLTTERMRIPQNGRISSSDINKFVDSTIADLQNTVNQVNVNESSTLDVLNTAIREISNLKKRVAQLEDQESFDRAIRAAQNLRIKVFKSMTDLTGITFVPGSNQATKPRINTLFNQATVAINALENKFYTNSIISGSIVPISQSIQIDVTSVIDAVDYEAGYVKLSEGNPENAFNGDNQSYWQRKVEFDLDSDVEEVQIELTVRVPDQANTEANALYIRPYPVSQVDIFDLGISADLSSAFSKPGNSYPRLSTAFPLDNARDTRFFFATQSVQRIRIRLRQRNWYEENGRKVFSYGLQELGLQLSEFDKTYSATAILGDNHTFITKFTCPTDKSFKGLHLFETTPDYTKDVDSMRFKISANVDGTNIKWDSSINSSPQSLVQPIDLGGDSSDLYVITTLNYIETADPASSNFFAGTTPVLSSIGIQYSVS